MSHVPNVPYFRRPNVPEFYWSSGRTPLPTTSRDTLVYGTYIPGSGTTGVIPGSVLTPWEASNPDGYITLTTPDMVYENYEFWGQVRPKAPGIVFKNCAFRGMSPSKYTTLNGLIKCYGKGFYHFTLIDCTIDSTPWVTQRGASNISPFSAGIHGGDFEMYRCEVTGVQDGVNYVAHEGWSEVTGPEDRWCLVEASWIHGMYYQNNWYGPSDGRTHSDAFQFNTGKNITIRNSMLGGERDMVGYRLWPGGYNSGDDAANALLMIKQELNSSSAAKIENVLIENNWFQGAAAGVNHYYSASRPNTFASLTFRNNKFFPRLDGWGQAAIGPGVYDSTLRGYQIMRYVQLESVYENNIQLPDGEPVKIHTDS